jgi:hypothetical protein
MFIIIIIIIKLIYIIFCYFIFYFIIKINRCDAEEVYVSVGYPREEIDISRDVMDFSRVIMRELNEEAQVLNSLIIYNLFLFFYVSQFYL